ncbi:MAG: MarR family transcriptional regulator [Oscillospiraceae bacterium]|nr:MarR family transcriptional regulator [Oscillospiraceae bacterium]
MVDRFRRFSLSLFEISRCWHKLAAEEMSKYGLKGPYAIYLVVLQHNPEGLTAARLCELCGRDKADVSRCLSAMQEKGLVVREKGNSYRAKILLTELGIQAAEHVCRRASVAVELAGKDVSDEDRAVFYQSLTSITENLRSLSRQGLPE